MRAEFSLGTAAQKGQAAGSGMKRRLTVNIAAEIAFAFSYRETRKKITEVAAIASTIALRAIIAVSQTPHRQSRTMQNSSSANFLRSIAAMYRPANSSPNTIRLSPSIRILTLFQ